MRLGVRESLGEREIERKGGKRVFLAKAGIGAWIGWQVN
jgi:hypothetical protein